ncbi:enoyl-CoA delta isomerase 1, peroxisomal [Aspergillus lentulus]|uniref:Enoyl-CoA delta isomerase 1, peroxisomal n=2 Tax=Aspergillus lentulus TaxID=293939 RepID=A0AAN4PHR1_ASPLE|nr:hypothetical protein CNMCM8060_007508 [Aspergillus lentulus]KAF4199209.1 hypothetical protein CNMCM8694_006055 [Aspergillus lentulus]GAQ06288.1 enoyl-CoA delta isomerase 1, peroxisomal [Aspergillus lentulus]
MSLFTIPISSTGGSIVCTNPTSSEKEKNIYLLTFTSPKDNRLTPTFIDALVLALDIIEHRFPKGVVITTSGIPKFYSNGLDLELATTTEGFLDKWLWKLFRRFLTFPMPTICLLNGHAFAGGLMLAMYHDYRIQNPAKGFLCINELEFGVPLQSPMMSIFREKLTPSAFRDLILEARRFAGPQSLAVGLVDGVGGLEETLQLIRERGLQTKAATGIYGTMKEEMYRHTLDILDNHAGNLAWREQVEEKKGTAGEAALRAVEAFEKQRNAKLKTSSSSKEESAALSSPTVSPRTPTCLFSSSKPALQSSRQRECDRLAYMSNGAMQPEDMQHLFQVQRDLIIKNNILFAEIGFKPGGQKTVNAGYWGLLPFARGNVHIRSSDLAARPAINPNYGLLDWNAEL